MKVLTDLSITKICSVLDLGKEEKPIEVSVVSINVSALSYKVN